MQPASKSNNYHYNKKLQSYANELRHNMTKAEACLWKYVLKAGELHGYKFRRQRPVLHRTLPPAGDRLSPEGTYNSPLRERERNLFLELPVSFRSFGNIMRKENISLKLFPFPR